MHFHGGFKTVGEIGGGQNHRQQFTDEISNPVSRTAVFQLIPILLSPLALCLTLGVHPLSVCGCLLTPPLFAPY